MRPVAAEALWKRLTRAGRHGITATDAAVLCEMSAPHARKLMRAWASAGLAEYFPAETDARDDSGRYVLLPGAPSVAPIVHKDGHVTLREAAMDPAEFAMARRRLGVSLAEMGRLLGWKGVSPTRTRAMRRIEQGSTPIDAALAEKVRALIN